MIYLAHLFRHEQTTIGHLLYWANGDLQPALPVRAVARHASRK